MWMWYTVIHPKVNLALKIHAKVNPYTVDLGLPNPS